MKRKYILLLDAGILALIPVAVLLAKWLYPELEYAAVSAGVACVLGHIFPFYLKFKGGKGFASYLGMTIALHWKFAIAVLLLVVVVTLITDYIVASSQLTQIHVAEDTRPLVTELKRIGNNLNQISMKINAGAFQSYNFREVIEMQRSIYEALLRIGGSQWQP